MAHEQSNQVMTKEVIPDSVDPDTDTQDQPDPDITRDPDGTPKENPSGATGQQEEEEADTASGGPADPPD